MAKKKSTPASPISDGPMLAVAARRWENQAAEALREEELTVTAFLLLDAIDRCTATGEPVTQTIIGRMTANDVMVTSKSLRGLEERGLIKRAIHPTDSRARHVTVTRDGANTLKAARKALAKIDGDLLGGGVMNSQVRKSLSTVIGG